MGHNHHHHHHPEVDDSSIWKLWVSIFLNLGITLAQVIGGIISNSLSLLSDAVHNFNDSMSLVTTLVTKKIAKKGANTSKTFGYKRAEIIGAFVNLITLVIVALFLIKEGIERFFVPETIDGLTMFWVAMIGLAANLITALLLWKNARDDLNMRAAFIHIMADAISSVGVVVGGWLIIQYNWYIVDAILTLLIGSYILWHSYQMLRETIEILMEAKPDDIEISELTKTMQNVDRVCGVHHVHVWQLDENSIMLESHIVILKEDMHLMEEVKANLKQVLHEEFDIFHSTLEFEFEPCNAFEHETLHRH
ncbi:MAG TPA: cation diffusion facilitator family transporter [Gracilimonas sp.]|nr:cation diffusion facilitator family transporter [Gracilimonas sp.]